MLPTGRSIKAELDGYCLMRSACHVSSAIEVDRASRPRSCQPLGHQAHWRLQKVPISTSMKPGSGFILEVALEHGLAFSHTRTADEEPLSV